MEFSAKNFSFVGPQSDAFEGGFIAPMNAKEKALV